VVESYQFTQKRRGLTVVILDHFNAFKSSFEVVDTVQVIPAYTSRETPEVERGKP
jgi:hypothetical protein